ncbi:T-cell surface glycoprotein CD4 isoform X2 [Pleuronectes platessa]|uniref:T-cell surface glycoprotein CD4 isoform X2 n=1 Tax=Pleuronectes platessa TaxID=8262 RepID=UPI00232A59BE|nr:T-cell surface glycoprotein CD4 isoform X2 [Pleuronectes platessa]
MEKFVLILLPALISTSGAKKSVYAQVGEDVVLKPPVIDSSNRYVYWTFQKEDGLELAWSNHLGGKKVAEVEPWKDKLTMSGDSLFIKKVQPENFGTFFCKIQSEIHSIELIKLDVSVSPAHPLLPGESLSLSCTVDSPKKPAIHWLNPRREKKGQGTVAVRVTSQDNGMWTCVVAEEKQVEMPVKVTGLSPTPVLPHYTSTSSRFAVPCSIPPPFTWEQIKTKGVQEVHWQFFPATSSGLNSAQRLFSLSLDSLSWKEDQPRDLRPASDPKTGNLELTRKLGRVDDRGDYVCTMKFKNGLTLNRTVHVEVLQIASSPGPHLLTGQQLNLTCSVGQPLPSDLQLQWNRPKRSAQPGQNSDQHTARLTIPEVSTDDGGLWVCGLWQGEKQLTSAVITLTIDPKVSVWTLVMACSAAAVVILLLLILALVLHRRRRRKMRHLRHQLCRCKKPKPKGFYRT